MQFKEPTVLKRFNFFDKNLQRITKGSSDIASDTLFNKSIRMSFIDNANVS